MGRRVHYVWLTADKRSSGPGLVENGNNAIARPRPADPESRKTVQACEILARLDVILPGNTQTHALEETAALAHNLN